MVVLLKIGQIQFEHFFFLLRVCNDNGTHWLYWNKWKRKKERRINAAGWNDYKRIHNCNGINGRTFVCVRVNVCFYFDVVLFKLNQIAYNPLAIVSTEIESMNRSYNNTQPNHSFLFWCVMQLQNSIWQC